MAKPIVIAVNQTASDILLGDIASITIPASGQVNLTHGSYNINMIDIQTQESLYDEVNNDNVLINNGSRTLSKQESLNYLTPFCSLNEAIVKNNFSATSNPTTGDDSDSGYGIGSRWINTSSNQIYQCFDATSSSANWIRLIPYTDLSYTSQFFAEESAVLNTSTDSGYQFSFGNGETGQYGGIVVQFESSYTCQWIGMTFSSRGNTDATILAVLNGVDQTQSISPSFSTTPYAATTFFTTPIDISNGDKITFKTSSVTTTADGNCVGATFKYTRIS